MAAHVDTNHSAPKYALEGHVRPRCAFSVEGKLALRQHAAIGHGCSQVHNHAAVLTTSLLVYICSGAQLQQ